MGRKGRDTTRYNQLGHLLDTLCAQRGWSYYRLEQESQTAKSSVLRASTGAVQPDLTTVLKWATALEVNEEIQKKLQHLAGYIPPDEKEQQIDSATEIMLQLTALEQRVASLEQSGKSQTEQTTTLTATIHQLQEQIRTMQHLDEKR